MVLSGKLKFIFRDWSNLVFAGLALGGAAVLILNCFKVWPFTIDDSFITFRYSRNLSLGIGPIYNVVGQRAEGYTSFLWMVVMTIPHFLKFGVVSFSKLIGMLSMLGTMVWMTIFLWHAGSLEDRGLRMYAAGLVVLFLGLLPETAVHAISGMETAGYVFLLSGLVTMTYLAVKGKRWAENFLPLVALLTGLMRPEANLLAAIFLSVVYFSGSKQTGYLLRVLLIYILPGVLYFLWRWNYFGVFLPLPFYIKTGGQGLQGLTIVLPFLILLISTQGLFAGIGLLGERRAVGLLLLAIIPMLLVFLFTNPIMNYDYRFVYPLLPLALILTGLGLTIMLKQAIVWSVGSRLSWLTPTWVGLLSLLMFSGQTLSRTSEVLNSKLDYAQGMSRVHYAIGHALYEVGHGKNSPVLAVTDAGAMPYISDWITVDCVGLNNTNIALKQVKAVDYIFEQNPEVVVLSSIDLNEYRNDTLFAQSIYTRAIDDGLIVVARLPFYGHDSIWILARSGGAASEKLRSTFVNQP